MAWNISSKQKAHQCTLEVADCYQTNLSLSKRSSERWKIWGSYEGQTVRGRLPCTWCRRTPAVGDRVANTDASMASRRPTAIRCHTSRTLPRNSRVLRFSLTSTWSRGYHQIQVAADDVSKIAVITPFGLFEFLRAQFGLKNAAQAFQRLMDTVCNGPDFVFVYLDDILVSSTSAEQHMLHLREVFLRLSTYGLVINVSNCQFGATTIDYLGHQITSQGAIPLPAKVEAIRTFARPTTIKGLQQFVGMLNFYHRFVPNAAHIMRPIYDALAGKPMTLKWSDELDEAFTTAKEALAQATMLVHPHADNPTTLTVDASGKAVGTVFEQNSDGSDWKPVAFFSRKRRPAEQKYSAFDRELLAVYLAIRHFRYFLGGRSFTLFTDHKPLTVAISKISDPWSPRQQ